MANMLKNMQNRVKNTSKQQRRATFWILVMISVALISFVIISTVFSANNVGTYNEEERIMIVRDSILSRDIIAEISLKSEDIVYVIRGKDRLVAEFVIKNNIEEDFTKVFNKMEFFDIKDRNKKFEREFTYKYKKSSGFKTVDDYGEVCTQEFNVTAGEHVLCRDEVVGTHQEETFKWVELERSEKLPAGELIIGVFTDVEAGESVEWIPTLFGVRIPQWSTWTESLNLKLNAYYYVDEGSGTFTGDAVGKGGKNLTVDNGAWAAGIIGSSNKIDGNTHKQPIINVGGNTSLTANIWVKGTASADQQYFISALDPQLANCDDTGWDDSPFAFTVMPTGAGRIFFCDGATRKQSSDHAGVGDNNWHMLTVTINSTNIYFYDDGASYDNDDYTVAPLFPNKWTNISGVSGGSGTYVNENFYLDEISFWTRDLTPTEVTQLYNSGSGIQYVFADTNPPAVTIQSPENIVYNTAINFSITVIDDDSMELGECWVTINAGVTNISMLNTTSNDVYNYSAPSIYSDGGYSAEFYCNDTKGNLNDTESISFTIDTINPNINITFPINESSHTNSGLNVNYTASDANLAYCWWSNDTMSVNHTLATCGTNITTITWSDMQHNVTVWVNDTAGNVNSSSVTFSIDAVPPNINITTPINNTNHTNRRIDVNYTVSDTIGIFNCWYSNDTYLVNTSLATCGTNITDVIWSYGQHNVTVWANDTAGNINHSRISFSIINIVENSQSFSATALERSSQTFSINITYDSNTFSNIQAILNYNNTEYSGTRVAGVGNGAVFNKTITVPQVTAKTNFTFYWEFTLTSTEDEMVNSTFYNQTVDNMVLGDCDSESIGLYNFTIVDEKTQIKLGNPTWNTSVNVHIELYTEDRTILIAEFFQNFTKVNPFSICINDSLAGGEKYSLDAQIQYGASHHVTEFYHIQSATIDSSTLAQNITLYDLANSSATTFKIIYKDANFLPLADALIQIQRKYIGEGVFKTVELPKTDSNGETVAHLEEEDAIYTFIIIKDGIIQATFNNFLVKCEDPVLGTCEISLNAFKSHLEPETFINLDDFLFTLSYNRTTRTVKTIYTIPTGNTATILLNTTLYDGLGTTQVCSDSLTSASGTLTCTVPLSFGNTTIVNTIYKDGVEVARGMVGIQESPSDLYGANLMFLSFFLIITMIGVGLGSSPMISGVFLIFGAVLSLAFNLVANTGFFGYSATILWIIIAIIIVLMKGSRRE